MTEIKASEELLHLIYGVIDYGSFMLKDGGDFTTSVIYVHHEKIKNEKIAHADNSQAVEFGRKRIKDLPPEVNIYAIAFQARVPHQNKQYDAIIIEAGERNQEGVTFAQRYQPKGFLKKFKLIGNPGYLGASVNYFN